ncbi:hypothetical protein NBE98_15950 [Clostridium swellfunianum]|uniref:hypothetical protein n=1 Tax=Clostridium swellfunianum TaxID=1367462 RepID=UPI00202DEEDF|nr:hypothetical protein [Clostridium swellfunianum]MCM0649860.1 hypothetical protein [Clostridium swellfunianum]
MKKVAAIVMSVLVVSSVSGCANRTTGYRNRNTGMYQGTNQGTTQGTRTGYGTNNIGTTQGMYRDGIYTGQGDKGANGNQTATVVISGGRITDVTLRTVDAQGRDLSGNIAPGRTTGMVGSTDNTAGNPGAKYYNTPGITTGGADAGMSSDLVGSPRGNTGYDATQNNIGMTGRTAGYGNAGTAGTYDRERTELARRIIDQQTADVALNEFDTSEGRNWKLAVRRALDKARTTGTTGTTTGGTTGGTGAGTGAGTNGGTMGGTTGGTGTGR